MAAARAVAAPHAAMDNFRRAAQPGVSDAVVVRLRSGALAAGRSVEAVLRARDRRRQQQALAGAKAPAPHPAVSREMPLQPVIRQDPAPRSPQPDYRTSTALSTTQRLEPLAALLP
jgi:hypothetical protein